MSLSLLLEIREIVDRCLYFTFGESITRIQAGLETLVYDYPDLKFTVKEKTRNGDPVGIEVRVLNGKEIYVFSFRLKNLNWSTYFFKERL
jgi:hypothetical protein